jgi:hypothetical protein
VLLTEFPLTMQSASVKELWPAQIPPPSAEPKEKEEEEEGTLAEFPLTVQPFMVISLESPMEIPPPQEL